MTADKKRDLLTSDLDRKVSSREEEGNRDPWPSLNQPLAKARTNSATLGCSHWKFAIAEDKKYRCDRNNFLC